MKKLIPVLTFVSIVSACAQNPDKIEAVSVSGDPYSRLSCSQLAAEKLKVSQELENAATQQRKAATGDTIGVLLLGLPVSTIMGGDQETQIAVNKGQIQELETQQLHKSCT